MTNGVFTNVYVYPDPSRESWEDHIAGLPANLRGRDAAQFSRAAIDAVTDRLMSPGFPTYFDGLAQYDVSPPQFFGSSVVSQSCIDAAMADANNGVLEWTTVRSLSNCHVDGMDPSPQLNLIFSPDIQLAKVSWPTADGSEMCKNGVSAYHAWGVNTPNFTAVPTSSLCAKTFGVFTQSLSHEMVELLTDPAGTGFGTLGNNQIADLCQSPDPVTTLANPPLSLARYWSDADNNCQPRLDSPAGSTSMIWPLGGGSPQFVSSVHSLDLPLPDVKKTTLAPATQVSLAFLTGAVPASLRVGGPIPVNVNLNWVGALGPTSTVVNVVSNEGSSAILNLHSLPVPVSDITGVTISSSVAGVDGVQFEKLALVISYPNGSQVTAPLAPLVDSWLDASAAPLKRFTGDANGHDLVLPVPVTDANYPLQALKLVISTGNDDLRGGANPGDNCDVSVGLPYGQVLLIPNVNGGQTWGGWTKHTVSIPIPPGLKGGDITSVSLHTGFAGDNWNVERVQLLATVVPLPPFIDSILPGSGRPGGGQPITITGSNFDTSGAMQFFFGDALAMNVVCTSRTLCTMFDPAGSGIATVTAAGPFANGTNTGQFWYSPSITSLSAQAGAPGDTITVYGVGLFAGVTSINFGPYRAQQVTCSTDQCQVVIPQGGGSVSVNALVNGVLTRNTPACAFQYSTPTVIGLDVASGPVSGYTTFNIDGSGFPPALGQSHYTPPQILFGNQAALDVFCPYDNWCTGLTPPGLAPGPVDVTVVSGGAASAQTVTFTYLMIDAIQSFSVTQTTATLLLNQPVPVGGAAFTLTSSDPSFQQMTLLVPAGAMGGTFQLPPWTTEESMWLAASYGGYGVRAYLYTVIPPPPSPPPSDPTDAGAALHCPKGTIDCGDGTCVKQGKLCQ